MVKSCYRDLSTVGTIVECPQKAKVACRRDSFSACRQCGSDYAGCCDVLPRLAVPIPSSKATIDGIERTTHQSGIPNIATLLIASTAMTRINACRNFRGFQMWKNAR